MTTVRSDVAPRSSRRRASRLFQATSTLAIKRLLLALIFGAVAGSIGLRVVSPARSARLDMLERHHAHLLTVNAALERRNHERMERLEALETSEDGWRDLARRQHGMLAPGEVIFRFPAPGR